MPVLSDARKRFADSAPATPARAPSRSLFQAQASCRCARTTSIRHASRGQLRRHDLYARVRNHGDAQLSHATAELGFDGAVTILPPPLHVPDEVVHVPPYEIQKYVRSNSVARSLCGEPRGNQGPIRTTSPSSCRAGYDHAQATGSPRATGGNACQAFLRFANWGALNPSAMTANRVRQTAAN